MLVKMGPTIMLIVSKEIEKQCPTADCTQESHFSIRSTYRLILRS